MDALIPRSPAVHPPDPEASTPAWVLAPGQPGPLGARPDGTGVNFAVFSTQAESVELCLFDESGRTETARLPLHRSGDIWHGHLAGATPGLVYGLRAHGPWNPAQGQRFNPNKLLLDPCAREFVGAFEWQDLHFAHDRQDRLRRDERDNAASALKARVVSPLDRRARPPRPRPRPRTAPADTVIYELHVKGFTQRMPGVPEALRGTYAGLASQASIDHLRALGVTSLSLLPVQAHLDEERLVRLGLSNYWGYNPLGWFAPHAAWSASGAAGARAEFRQMVRSLQDAGLEVLLDVVYNHTAEGDEDGPSLHLRGLDNALAYRSLKGEPGRYDNLTGCGHAVDLRHPGVLRLVMDSLRHWADEMEVDGFRFDLAPVLGRGDAGFDARSAFFTALAQDPVLSQVKLIAEPWDLGPGGYQLGAFPRGWMEWNDRFRDDLRAFWLGAGPGGPPHAATRGQFAQRLCGSSDLFGARGRQPFESVNFITAHDGFTLADLLRWENRRNEANGEANRDGHGHNLGWNCGAEGPSDDPLVLQRRSRLARALLATLLLSQGTPLLTAGDEVGRTQGGNNNAYCQDNAVSWLDWEAADRPLLAFTRRVLALRSVALPLRSLWYTGASDARGLRDLAWLEPDGQPLEGSAWHDPSRRVLGCLIGRPGRSGAPLLLLVNAEARDHAFHLPAGVWRTVLDTTAADGNSAWHGQGDATHPLQAHSLQLLASAGAERDIGRALEQRLAPSLAR